MKKKIAVIGLKGLPAFGGAATVGENIIEQLKDKYDFTVYATSSHTDKMGSFNGYKQIVFKKIAFKRLNTFYYYILSAVHAVIKSDYDLVHLHHTTSAFIIPILKIRYKIISTSHSSRITKYFLKYKSFLVFSEKVMIKYSNIITVVALTTYERYKKMTKNCVYYIPNGVNQIVKFSKEEFNKKNYLMFAAGRILPSKGCHIFLEALNKIKYRGKIIIAGNLSLIPEYETKVKELSSSLDVEFTSLIKKKVVLNSYIKNARLFIFSSSIEAMSMMLLEVASIKTPLICSDIPENKAVFNEEEVLFFSTDNADELALRISWALENEELMKRKAQNAFNKLKKDYLWENIAKQYDKLYQKLLK